MLRIGERIRAARLRHHLSQGDLESRTGLLRCYLSRVENGHTEPSLQTLVRIANALPMPLVEFFQDAESAAVDGPPALNEQDLAFLTQMRGYARRLSAPERQQILDLARQMASAEPVAGVSAKAAAK